MKILTWDSEQELAEDSDFIIIDRNGNKWRIDEGTDPAWPFQLMFVQTETGTTKRVAVRAINGNVMDVGPA